MVAVSGGRRVLIGIAVVILGIVALPAASYSTSAKVTMKHRVRCAKASRSKAKRAKRRAGCKKPLPSKQQTPEIVAEAEAQRLLGELALPEGAARVNSEQGLVGPESRPATRQLVDADRYWHLPGEPSAVIAWIEAHPPGGARLFEHGEASGPGGVTKWFGAFSFPVEDPDALSSEELAFQAIPAEGGGTALRADAQVIWIVPRPSSEHIPAGVSAISVRATASVPTPVSVSQTISEPAAVQKVIAMVEGLKPPGGAATLCPIHLPGFELEFLEAGQPEPVVTLITKPEGCDIVEFWVHGHVAGRLGRAGTVVQLIEELLATKL
jgi:hypothetical protein